MSIEVKVPVLPESVSDATIATWHKKAGDAVKRDENLVDLETDKVVLEVPSPVDGVLKEIKHEVGDTVNSEQIIAIIEEGAAAAKEEPKADAKDETPAPVAAAKSEAPKAEKASGKGNEDLSPAGLRVATEQKIDASKVEGTGRDGRVTKEDLVNYSKDGGSSKAATQAAKPTPGSRPEERVPMSRLRARIAERLVQSQSTNAILTTFNEVNMQPVMDLRAKYKDKFEKEHGVKLGFMSFFVKAAVHALKKFPLVNASIDGNDIVYHGYFDIGIAVGSPRGLVVPILRNADQMTFAEIEKKIAEFGQKAKDGKLSLEEMTGGTFSISNGGTFGSMLSTPIINPPQSAILGVHATKDRAVVVDGQIVIRPMNYLAMSYDHRIIDGREAVLGLVAMKDALEDPSRLLFDI